MSDFVAQKKQTEAEIVQKVLAALEKNALSHTQLPAIGEFTLSSLRIAKNKDDLDVILTDLQKKWPQLENNSSVNASALNPDASKKNESLREFLKSMKNAAT